MNAGVVFFEPTSYSSIMRFFSKKKNELDTSRLSVTGDSSESIQPLSTEFVHLLKSWIPDDFCCKVNSVEYEAEDVRDNIEFLVVVAVERNDHQLYDFVGANSECFRSEFQYITVEGLARHLFQGTISSMELRKKYKSVGAVLEAVTSLGIAAHINLEQHPKYKAALEYMSNNSDNLS
jgi:hypothetical protein